MSGKTLMEKEEFEKRYIEQSGISAELYHQTQVTLPCNCGEEGCEGWAAVTPLIVKAHLKVNGIKEENG